MFKKKNNSLNKNTIASNICIKLFNISSTVIRFQNQYTAQKMTGEWCVKQKKNTK